MKLREKFKTEFSINTSGESGRFADKCESIADYFAIGFAKWSESYTYHEKFNAWIKNNSLTVEKKTTKELLEIYKKEKNL